MYSVVLKNFFTLKRFLAFVNSVSGGFVCLFVCLFTKKTDAYVTQDEFSAARYIHVLL